MPSSRTWLAVAAAATAITLATAGVLVEVRAEALARQGDQIATLAQQVTDETDRGLQDTDAGLVAVRAELQDGRLVAEAPDTPGALQRLCRHMPLVETLWLVDDAWNPIAASDGSPLPPVAALSRGTDAPGRAGLVIGQPAPGEDASHARVILARRFGSPPGQASGWILAAVPESALLGHWVAEHPLATHLAIFRTDGVRLAGSLENAQQPSEPFSALRLTALHIDHIHHFRDGSERLVGMHDARHYDVTVVLTRDLDDVLAEWRMAMRLAVVAIVALVGVACAGVIIVRRSRTLHG